MATVWPLRGHCVATAVAILLVVRLPPIRHYGLTQSLPNQLEASVDIQRLTTRYNLALAIIASIIACGVSRISFYDRRTKPCTIIILAPFLVHTCLHLSCRCLQGAMMRSSVNSNCIGIPKQRKASNSGRTKPCTTWLDPTGLIVSTCLSLSVFPG